MELPIKKTQCSEQSLVCGTVTYLTQQDLCCCDRWPLTSRGGCSHQSPGTWMDSLWCIYKGVCWSQRLCGASSHVTTSNSLLWDLSVLGEPATLTISLSKSLDLTASFTERVEKRFSLCLRSFSSEALKNTF